MAICRVAVGEIAPELSPGSQAWTDLIRDLERLRPDLFVLNELPFGPWLAARPDYDRDAWRACVAAHEHGVAAVRELGVPTVLGSRAVDLDGRLCNQGFIWRRAAGLEAIHTKQHLPRSPGYWETSWTQPGRQRFQLTQAGPLRVGMLICTDIMFNEHARQYGRDEVDLIVVPRATPPLVAHQFEVALQMTAIVSGCYVASSDRRGTDSAGEAFAGRGCIINPIGQTVAATSFFSRVAVHDIDTDFVRGQQQRYPCNVVD